MAVSVPECDWDVKESPLSLVRRIGMGPDGGFSDMRIRPEFRTGSEKNELKKMP